jgi:cytoskeletal protein CcmA (bactofilin family)
MKKIIIVGVVAGLLPAVALAAYVGAGDSVSAPSPLGGTQPAVQNIYLAGGTVNVSNPVAGDVIAVGGTIVISGKVDQDIMAAGGNISIVGGSAEDIRTAGGNITIGGKVNGEIMAAGGQVAITTDAVIARDSYIVGGSLVFAGTENGNLTLAGGQIRIDGTVNGNLMIKRAEKVTFGPQAIVKGAVEYSAPEEATILDGAQIAATPVFHRIQSIREGPRTRSFTAFFGVLFFLKVIATLAAAYLLWYLRRRDMTTAIESVHEHFWNALLRGFAVLVLMPAASIILLFTVVGWIPAVAMLAAYGALLALAVPIAVIIITSLVMALLKKSHTDLKWYYILGGLFVLKLLALIPVVGWLACFVIYLVSLGAASGIVKAKFAA